MMMIAYININSGLVPLIEGLCAQIHYLRLELPAKLLDCFLRSNKMYAYTYICIYIHIYIYI